MRRKILLSTMFLYCFAIISTEPLKEIFTHIYATNFWRSKETFSGGGSELIATQSIRQELPRLFKELKIKTLLDAPCGDFWWMKEVDISMLDKYIGVDIVKELIEKNNNQYKTNQKEFACLDIVEDVIPTVDCILCRDCLVHLTFEQINKVLHNFKKSNSKYLLLTTYPNFQVNEDLSNPGDWRQLNFQKPPFNFPAPEVIVSENYNYKNHNNTGKHLAIWKLDEIIL